MSGRTIRGPGDVPSERRYACDRCGADFYTAGGAENCCTGDVATEDRAEE